MHNKTFLERMKQVCKQAGSAIFIGPAIYPRNNTEARPQVCKHISYMKRLTHALK